MQYYRRVVAALDLPVTTFVEVVEIERRGEAFRLGTCDIRGREETVESRNLVLATGAHDRPRMLDVPGEDLPHVAHEYDGPHEAFGRTALVVGGRNSAVEAALELHRAGVPVTLSYRREAFDERSVKYWMLPDIRNRIEEGSIRAVMPSEVEEIRPGSVTLRTPDGPVEATADFVYLLVGHVADPSFLESLGVEFREDGTPVHDEVTRETSVPGLFLAGRVCAGDDGNRIFIENGREHGAAIVACIAERV
jgi:thioredoxin reductase (NADPH)